MTQASAPITERKYGPYTKRGSSLLVMSIIGGAVCPAIMGIISDASSIQRAFVVPLICYVYAVIFAMRGHRPESLANLGELPEVAPNPAK